MANENHNLKPIKERVLEAIKSGNTHMRPKWHFILYGALFVIGGIILLLVILYLASFIVFTVRHTGVVFAPRFGSRGLFVFLRSLPWLLILLSLFFIVILEVLVRRYSFAYRKPLLYSIFAIVLIVVVGGVSAESLHRPIFRAAGEDRLPFGGRFYQHFGMPHFHDIHRGTVGKLTDNGFTLKEEEYEATSTVFINDRTRMPPGIDIKEGDTVVVFGDSDNGEIQSYGIQEIEE